MKKKETNIGGNIRNFRELKGLTREQMAHDLNLSVSAYGNIERNQTDLKISRIQQIAEILGVEMSQILNFDASQVFNIEHNDVFNTGANSKTEYHSHPDEYKDKYIKKLEEENEQMKAILEKYKISAIKTKTPFFESLITEWVEEEKSRKDNV
jgi:transcriptional regulator with XRE-family HTH domain